MENILEKPLATESQDKGDLIFYLMLFLFMVGGAVLGTILVVAFGSLMGMNLSLILGDLGEDPNLATRNFLRNANGLNHVFTFFIAALSFATYFFGRKYLKHLGFKKPIKANNILLGAFFIIAAFPLVQALYWINRQLPLPEGLKGMEASAEAMLNAILTMESPWELLLNLFIIAVLPAFGEELIFRGLLQKRLEKSLKNGVSALWLSAAIFSAIHFQFEGFLPRLFLGAILGYLFYWTRNLWIPIIAHFLFNGAQVLGQYFFPEQIEQLEKAETVAPNWVLSILSLLIVIGISFLLKKQNSQPQTEQ